MKRSNINRHFHTRHAKFASKYPAGTAGRRHVKALNDRQFKTLLDEVGNNYPDLLLHSNVCWLSRGEVLSRFAARLSQIQFFLEIKNVEHPELADTEWPLKFHYHVDMTEHLIQLNVKMQGIGNTILSLQQAVFAFENKLELYRRQ